MQSCLYLTAIQAFGQQQQPTADSIQLLIPVEIRAVRASTLAPFTKTNLDASTIRKNNLGQDIPFLLNQAPSVVVNSDAGNGFGYTGMRIRGSDATRINVTLNGIPYNDAESQGTFFVDLPDFASSTSSIQIQRGVGTSSNGAGAFGASVHFSTNETNPAAYAEFNNGFGSFSTRKHTLRAGTGIINGFSTDVRFSLLKSDGYIDRASSNLRSFYISQAFTKNKTGLRLNVFSGKEKTYQAWNGISQQDLDAGNRTINYAGMEKPGEPYEDETDNYTQTHYQFFFSQGIGKKFQLNTAFFLSKGEGYYENYKAGEDYADYNMPYPVNGPDTTFTTDLVTQRWLDNDYYGTVFSLLYKDSKSEFTLGGGLTQYDGLHFGKIPWAAGGLTGIDTWYRNNATKRDANIYLKEQTRIATNWHLFYDVQYRYVRYQFNGFRQNPGVKGDHRYHFINPKAGITYFNKGWKAYFSHSIANKEPNRDDFEAGISSRPGPERLFDTELGIERAGKTHSWGITLYHMYYKDQLVLTGKINDVGAYTRTNIPKSYRAGIELQGAIKPKPWLQASGNLSISRNKVISFSEFIDDYDNGGQKLNQYERTDLAFSPGIVGALTTSIIPASNWEISFPSKYVGKQYLDNTQNEGRKLDPFFVQDLRVTYTVKCKWLKEITITGQVLNVFNNRYEPNGYTFSYIAGGGLITENYYFPMAGRNFMTAVNVRF